MEPFWVKKIRFNGQETSYLVQQTRHASSLLALSNALLLERRLYLPPQQNSIPTDHLVSYLAECLLSSDPSPQLDEAISQLSNLLNLLDLEAKLDSISSFEHRPELVVFQAFNIPLVHGCLASAEIQQEHPGKSIKQIQDERHHTYLEGIQHSITPEGKDSLSMLISDLQVSVLYWKKQFYTLYKRNGALYTLVTAEWNKDDPNVVWESLSKPGHFFDASFAAVIPGEGLSILEENERNDVEDRDIALAMSLMEEDLMREEQAKAGQASPQRQSDSQVQNPGDASSNVNRGKKKTCLIW